MDTVETNDDLRLRRLSLIDFASEDDFLLSSPSGDLHDVNSLGITKEDVEHKMLEQEAVESSKIEERTENVEQREDEPELLPSLEPERVRKNGKYNLRKSLAWDSAFFTSAGVLDPEELSSMMGQGDKNEKHGLPSISEDIQKSSDSISTLESETMPLESIEENLFEDIRASIQKSSGTIGDATSGSKAESRRQETRKLQPSRRIDLTSQNKIKHRSTSQKQVDGSQGPGRNVKQSAPHPRSGQNVKVVSKLPPCVLPNKRPSSGPNLPTIGSDSTRSTSGRGASVVPRDHNRSTAPKLPQSLAAAKKGQTTISQVSVSSSENVGKSSLVRRKIESKTSPSLSSTHKTKSQILSKVKTSVGNSHSSLTSTTKHSSVISPVSSVSEWSTESSSSSILDLQSNSSRASLHSISSKRVSIDRDVSHAGSNRAFGAQMTGLASQPVKKVSGQSSVLPPASGKPSGLRLPSPKIGFFDGAKASSMKGDPVVTGGTTKIGAGSVSISGVQNKINPAKLQTARVSVKSTNHSTRPNTTKTNLKSHKPKAVKEFSSELLDISLQDSDVSSESNQNSNMSQENKTGSNLNDPTMTCTDGDPNKASE